MPIVNGIDLSALVDGEEIRLEAKERLPQGNIVWARRDGNCICMVNDLHFRDKTKEQMEKEMSEGNIVLMHRSKIIANGGTQDVESVTTGENQ